ncbi:MAG: glycosyltransferase family 2 protein [Armatimonadota bacterium]
MSVVVPAYNEVDSVEPLCRQIISVMGQTGRPYEVIFVDDGSSDGTFERLEILADAYEQLRVVKLRRNFGQTAAMSAGFDYASGEVIVSMDGDMQNDPQEIPRLLEKMAEGYDVVSGWRVRRQDRFLTRKVPSVVANWLIGRLTGVRLHDYGCSLKAYKREILRDVHLYGEMHRFIPALCRWTGAKIAEIPVNHFPRTRGRSKYGLSRAVRVMLDMLTVKFLMSFLTKPMQIFGGFGLALTGTGFAAGAYLTFVKLAMKQPIAGRPLLLLAVLLISAGLQFLALGLLGEVLTRIYYESQGKPVYRVERTIR